MLPLSRLNCLEMVMARGQTSVVGKDLRLFEPGVPWAFANGTLPRESPLKEYGARIEARPAYQRAAARWGLANP